MTEKVTKEIKRYTSFLYLKEILKNKSIFLVDYNKWKDSNDNHTINLFKEYLLSQKHRSNKVHSIHAACFTLSKETHHHWETFTTHDEGVCITFSKDQIEKSIELDINEKRELIYQEVKYIRLKNRKLNDCDTKLLEYKDIQFIKRFAYETEKEFRVISINFRDCKETTSIPISTESISGISFNPYMSAEQYEKLCTELVYDFDFPRTKITKSRIVDSTAWKS